MTEELHPKIEKLLEQVLPKIQEEPSLLFGFVEDREIDEIKEEDDVEKRSIPLKGVTGLALREVFISRHDVFGISKGDGNYLKAYFKKKAEEDKELLKKRFIFLTFEE